MQLKLKVAVSGGSGAREVKDYGGVPGLCGDPFLGHLPNSNFKGLPCEPQETYQQGGIMRTRVDIAANHGGYWELSICDRKDISQECFDRNKLTSSVPFQTSLLFVCAPKSIGGSFTHSSTSRCKPSYSLDPDSTLCACVCLHSQTFAVNFSFNTRMHGVCRLRNDHPQYWIMTRKVDNPSIENPDTYFMEWQLPSNLLCGHCVVQAHSPPRPPPIGSLCSRCVKPATLSA